MKPCTHPNPQRTTEECGSTTIVFAEKGSSWCKGCGALVADSVLLCTCGHALRDHGQSMCIKCRCMDFRAPAAVPADPRKPCPDCSWAGTKIHVRCKACHVKHVASQFAAIEQITSDLTAALDKAGVALAKLKEMLGVHAD